MHIDNVLFIFYIIHIHLLHLEAITLSVCMLTVVIIISTYVCVISTESCETKSGTKILDSEILNSRRDPTEILMEVIPLFKSRFNLWPRFYSNILYELTECSLFPRPGDEATKVWFQEQVHSYYMNSQSVAFFPGLDHFLLLSLL